MFGPITAAGLALALLAPFQTPARAYDRLVIDAVHRVVAAVRRRV